jgi:hypothetical protein
MIYINTQCLFYFKQFTRPRNAYEHIEKLYLKYYKLDDLIPCPHLVYKMDEVVLDSHMHFKNHATTTYNIYLSEKCRQ